MPVNHETPVDGVGIVDSLDEVGICCPIETKVQAVVGHRVIVNGITPGTVEVYPVVILVTWCIIPGNGVSGWTDEVNAILQVWCNAIVEKRIAAGTRKADTINGILARVVLKENIIIRAGKQDPVLSVV